MAFYAGLWFSGCVHSESRIDKQVDIEKIIEAKLSTWPAVYDANDEDRLNQFLNDDFVFIDNSGKLETKAQIMDRMSTPGLSNDTAERPDDFVYTIKDILFLTDDVVMVYGHGDSTRQTETGKPCAYTYWSSNVLRRVGDDWRPSFSHVSAVTCTPI